MLDSLHYRYFQIFSLNLLKSGYKLASKVEAYLSFVWFGYFIEIVLDLHFIYPVIKIKATKALPIKLEKFTNKLPGCLPYLN